MPSSPDSLPRGWAHRLERGNARLHYYSGLYFLFFIWLFAVTGLLLNHGSWGMEDAPRNRTTTRSEHRVTLPEQGPPAADARSLMQALRLEGEIQWVGTTAEADRLVFRVIRPGRQVEVRHDRRTSLAVVEQNTSNAVGIARAVHLFTGVRMNDARNERDWIVTQVWALAMDAVAAGLLVLVAGGIALWWRSGEHRGAGLIALGAGTLCCGWFVVGLASFTG